MKKIITLSIIIFCLAFSNKITAQGGNCSTATPFCTAVGSPFIFPNVHNASTAQVGPAYGCLCSEPNPSWFYIKASANGTLTYNISQSTTAGGAANLDVDFVVWGPFTAATFPNACNNLVGSCTGGCSTTANPGCAGGILDCSYSIAATENMTINAVAGDYYIVMITNFIGTAGYISFTQTSGQSTDCSITCPGVATGITMQMQDSANYSAATSTYVATGSTLNCSAPYYWLFPQPALSSNPADIMAPCLAINYNPTIATIPTKENVTVSEGGNTIFQFCPSGCPSGQMYQYGEMLYMLDSSQAHSFTFCGTAGGAAANTTVSIQNCWSGAVLAGPQAMNIKSGTCYTLTVPANTNMGYAYYTIAPASGNAGIIDLNDGYLIVVPNALPSSTTYTVTYHFKGPDGCAFGLGTYVFTTPAKPTVTITPSATAICTGSAVTLTAGGANTYTWSQGSATTTTLSVSPTNTASPTSYTVVGTNTTTACTNSAVGTVSVNPLPTINISASPSPSVCLGSSSSFTASGASTYTWTSSANGGLSSASGSNVSGTPTTIANATYTVNATDANGCKNSKTLTINVNPLPTLTLTASSNLVCTSASATLTATTGGVNTYTWSSSAGGGLSATSGSSVTASPTSTPATYTVVGTNTVTGCQSASKTTTITITTTPTVSLSQATYTTCLNVPVTFTASGASTYTWTPTTGMTGSTSANPVVTPTSTTTTVYSVNGSSGGCTSSAATVTLTVNLLPTISVVPTSTAICSGGGNTTLTASGANTYTWNPAGTLSSANGSIVTATPTNTASATVYTVTGTDANNCVNKNTVSITVNQTPTVTVSGGGGNSQVVCGGGLANTSVTGITFGVSPAGSVSWTNDNTAIGLAASGNGNIATYSAPTVTAQTIGIITANATATGSGCASTSSTQLTYTITINPIPGETGQVISPAGCGLSDGTIIGATGTGGSTYAYSWDGGVTFGVSSSYTNAAGTYPLQIKDNSTGCIYFQNFTIPNAGAPAPPTVTPSATAACVGGTVILTAPAVVGTTYNWTEANGNTGTGNTYTVTNMPASPNPYTIGVTATASGCTGVAGTTSITVNPLPNPAISSSTSQICQGSSITLSVTPIGSYSYQWGNSSGSIAGATSNTLSVSASDTYLVTVTDNTTNCSASTSANGTITVNSLPVIDATGVITTQSSCTVATGSINNVTITGAPAITYTWTSGTALPTGVVISAGTGGTASLSNAAAGAYCLNVIDGNSCASSYCSVSITNAGAPPQPVLTAAGNDTTYCQGDVIQTLTVTVSSGTLTPTINWYSDAGLTNVIASNTNTYTPAGIPVGTPTTIYVAATSNGCIGTSRPITITIIPTPTINITPLGSNSVICNGSSVVITPSGATTYTLNPGNITGTSFTVSPTTIGTNTYTIDGNSGATGCSNLAANQGLVSITVNPTPTITIAPLGSNSVICNGSSVVITPSGATTYTLNPGNITGTSFTVSPTTIGTNTYTIDGSSGATGCANASANQGLASITVNPTPTISINPLGSNSVICNGSSVVITPSGATTYTLNPGNLTGTSFTVSPTTIGTNTYSIDGSNSATNCSNASSDIGLASITVNATPTITIAPLGSNSVICNGSSVVITPSGATTYTLNPGNLTGTSFTVNPTTIGTNTYTIDGSNGAAACTNLAANQAMASITVNPTPTVDVSGATLVTANCGQATGGVNGISGSNVSGGTTPYNYQWINTATGAVVSTSASLSNAAAGNYSLEVTDANNCVANVSGGVSTFSVPSSVAVHAQFTTNPSPAAGTIPLAISFSNTSTGASNYIWTFGDGSGSISANANNTYTNTGTYIVTLVALNGTCTDTARAIVVADIPTTLIIPNVFSPNGDGTNDQFFINNTGMRSLNCNIFNRWGQLLFSITAPDQAWDGKTPNGLAAPEGTYMYMLEALGLDGKTYKQQGTVTLVR